MVCVHVHMQYQYMVHYVCVHQQYTPIGTMYCVHLVVGYGVHPMYTVVLVLQVLWVQGCMYMYTTTLCTLCTMYSRYYRVCTHSSVHLLPLGTVHYVHQGMIPYVHYVLVYRGTLGTTPLHTHVHPYVHRVYIHGILCMYTTIGICVESHIHVCTHIHCVQGQYRVYTQQYMYIGYRGCMYMYTLHVVLVHGTLCTQVVQYPMYTTTMYTVYIGYRVLVYRGCIHYLLLGTLQYQVLWYIVYQGYDTLCTLLLVVHPYRYYTYSTLCTQVHMYMYTQGTIHCIHRVHVQRVVGGVYGVIPGYPKITVFRGPKTPSKHTPKSSINHTVKHACFITPPCIGSQNGCIWGHSGHPQNTPI